MGMVSESLGIAAFSRSDFVRLLDHILQKEPVRALATGRKTPAPPEHECIEMYPKFVFDIPLSGCKHLIFGDGSGLRECHLSPGEVLFTPPAVWKLPVWDTAHELCCLVYTDSFLRCTYVDYSEPDPGGRRPVCAHFYHTDAPPSPPLNELLHLIAGLDGEAAEAGADLARALFRLTRDFLAEDTPRRAGKAERTFSRIRQYMLENFSLPLTREETAERFQLNPGYLSRLFRLRAADTFSGVLRTMRMEHAAFLLKNTELLIDEITFQCGYRSTPFFTSAFRRHFGVPPGQFRLKSRTG